MAAPPPPPPPPPSGKFCVEGGFLHSELQESYRFCPSCCCRLGSSNTAVSTVVVIPDSPDPRARTTTKREADRSQYNPERNQSDSGRNQPKHSGDEHGRFTTISSSIDLAQSARLGRPPSNTNQSKQQQRSAATGRGINKDRIEVYVQVAVGFYIPVSDISDAIALQSYKDISVQGKI